MVQGDTDVDSCNSKFGGKRGKGAKRRLKFRSGYPCVVLSSCLEKAAGKFGPDCCQTAVGTTSFEGDDHQIGAFGPSQEFVQEDCFSDTAKSVEDSTPIGVALPNFRHQKIKGVDLSVAPCKFNGTPARTGE